MLLAAFVVSQSCQSRRSGSRRSTAVATAKRQVDFAPKRTQVRLVRQGLNSQPNWIVSLSIPRKGAQLDTQEFRQLAVVRVDANTGKVVDVKVQR